MELKSSQELYTMWWLQELQDNGFISGFSYETASFTLSEKKTNEITKHLKTKEKIVESHLLNPHIYTPDFVVFWTPKGTSKFVNHIHSGDEKKLLISKNIQEPTVTLLEVKAKVDRNNTRREFSLNQKWIYDKLGLYVNLFIPETIFKNTFVPERYFLTDKSMKPRKQKWEFKTLKEFING